APAVVYQFQMTPDGAFTFPHVSEMVTRIMGVSAGDVARDPSVLLDMVHPEDREKFQEGILKSARTLEPYHEVIRCIKEGETIWIEVRSMPGALEDGSVLWDGFFVDVTDRKRAEEALRKREERYQLLFNSVNDALFVHGVEEGGRPGGFIEANDVAGERLGYSREELMGLSPLDIDAEGMNEARRRALDELAETGKCVFEMVHVGKSGNKIPVEIASRLFEIEGKAHVLSLARDITERKRAEEARRTERDKLRGVLDGVGEGMYIVDKKGVIEFQNEIMETLYPGGVGAKCHALYLGSAVPCENCKLGESITSGQIQRTESVFLDGNDFDLTFSPFTDMDGEVKAIVLARDISEKKILQAEAARAGQLA
ncbi:MAG: PAS domain S-box protein, partial [Desulfobacterales bacterium]|nr:PAS domain S-box protein [Desulfobacterales bacterium]